MEFDPDGAAGGSTVTGYAIYTAAQLQHLALHLNSNAVLMNDLDFTGTTTGAGDVSTPMGALKEMVDSGITYTGHPIDSFTSGNFVPIGRSESVVKAPYTGVFCGNDKSITGLHISGSAVSFVGLFGYTSGAAIKDLILAGGTVTGDSAGGVIGLSDNTSTVSGCSNAGAVNGYYSAGGVVGWSYNLTISSCSNTGTVNGYYSAGGVVGWNYNTTISSCSNTGAVNGREKVGGVAGFIFAGSSISGSCNTGAVTGSSDVGGVVGLSDDSSTVSGCSNTGAVTGSSDVGGLVGCNDYSTVSGCSNTGAVTGGNYVGGLVGVNETLSNVRNSCNTGAVSGSSYVGGVVGKNFLRSATVSNSYNTGAVSGSSEVGGVVGYNETVVSDSSNTGMVNDAFPGTDPTISEISASMAAIIADAGWSAAGAITDISFGESSATPETFNLLQGSYIISGSSMTITITALSGTTVTVATGAALDTILTSGGIAVDPATPEGNIYTLSGLDSGTWILIRAVNAEAPEYNRVYTLYIS